MKKLLSLLLTLLLAFSLCLISSAFPIEKEDIGAVNITGAEINCVVGTDGVVEVTEIWTVEYMTAANKFCRVIDTFSTDNGMTLQQRYNIIGGIEVSVDGKELKYAENEKNAYFYSEPDDGENYDIIINYPAAQTVKEYEIKYYLYGAAKKVDGEAVFDYMVIGKSFPYTANNVIVNVTYPSGETDVVIPDNPPLKTETFEYLRVYDLLSVQVTADEKFFENGALGSYSGFSQFVYNVNNVFNSAAPYILAATAIVLVILLVLFYDRLISYSARKKAKLLIKAQKADGATLPEGISPCVGYKMLVPLSRLSPKKSAKKVPLLFAAAVLECMELGYITPDGKDFIVGTPKNDAPAYILSVLNFLKTFCETKRGKYIIDEDFSKRVQAECMSRYDVIANYLATFYSLIPSVDTKFFRSVDNREKYAEAYAVKAKAVEYAKTKTYFTQYVDDVLSGKPAASAEVFALMFENDAKVFEHTKGIGGVLSEALLQMYIYYLNVK